MEIMILLIWMHFIADFVLQSSQMAVNKSRSIKWLAIHVFVYSMPFLMFGWAFALINGAAHFITDFITSKITSRLWAKGETHWFFVVIGFDQAIHMTTLFVTYQLLIGF